MTPQEETELEHYLAISRAVAGEFDLQNVLDRIAGAVQCKLLRYDHLDVAVLMPGDSSMHVSIETGVSTLWGKDGRQQPTSNSPIRQLLHGEVDILVTGDAWEDPRFHFDDAFDQPIFDANLRSRIHVPLIVHGEVIGALNISSHEKNAYVDADVAVTRNVADLIAPYFYALSMSEQAKAAALAEGAARGREQSLKLGAQKLTKAMEAERQRLGMELHDQTLADLSGIYRQMSVLAKSPNPSHRVLLKLSEDISRCTAELRNIIENAKPGVLDLFGLTEAIETQLDRSTQGMDRKIDTSVNDTTGRMLDRADYGLQLAVFRIVQEAVTNAVKHSECSRINIELRNDGEVIQIVVSNDGLVPPEGWRRSSGGVDNIKFRAALIGASVDFERDPEGCGSSTSVNIPVTEALSDKQTSPEIDDIEPNHNSDVIHAVAAGARS